MIEIIKGKNNLIITLIAVEMGSGWNISVMGGHKPHVGAVALGIPRKSLQDEKKISSSVSVLTITGHKEDEVVRSIAKKDASELNKTVVVVCGIHNDNITIDDINIFIQLINEANDEFINKAKKILY